MEVVMITIILYYLYRLELPIGGEYLAEAEATPDKFRRLGEASKGLVERLLLQDMPNDSPQWNSRTVSKLLQVYDYMTVPKIQ